METIRLTMAQAVVEWLTNQYTEIDGSRPPFSPVHSGSSVTAT